MTRFKLYEKLDTIYHKLGNFRLLRFACDRYDEMLNDVDDLDLLDYYELEKWEDLPDPYALRCPVCEGIDYPGLNHNTNSVECSLFDLECFVRVEERRTWEHWVLLLRRVIRTLHS
jgi:hypothetical protein